MKLKPNTLIFITHLCLFFSLGVTECGYFSNESPVVARVGNSILTEETMKKSLDERLSEPDSIRIKKSYINRWIEQELLYQGALLAGYSEDEQIKNELSRIRKQLITDKYLDQELKWRSENNEDEIRKYYEDHLDSYIADETGYAIQHITVNTADDAKKVMVEIKKRIALEEIKSENLEVSTGFLAFMQNPIPEKAIPKEFFKIIQRLETGETSNYFLYDNVYHIVKLMDKILAGKPIPLKYVQQKVEERLYLEKRKEEYNKLIRNLGSEVEVYIYEDQEPLPFIMKDESDSLKLMNDTTTK